ncbi:MAG: hypothetical protein HC797_07245 [Anaerolineales bacterium]|nr:hypothetical protein [Anaerolineales bacterium]
MKNILDTIDNEIENGNPVYVHCWGGVGRTGITAACYLIRHGLSHEKHCKKCIRCSKPDLKIIIQPRPKHRFNLNLYVIGEKSPLQTTSQVKNFVKAESCRLGF